MLPLPGPLTLRKATVPIYQRTKLRPRGRAHRPESAPGCLHLLRAPHTFSLAHACLGSPHFPLLGATTLPELTGPSRPASSLASWCAPAFTCPEAPASLLASSPRTAMWPRQGFCPLGPRHGKSSALPASLTCC